MTRALLVLVVLGRVAFADDQPQGPVGPGVIAARLYKEGHFAEAAKEFEKAYQLAPAPALLFNIAQSYRFANDCAAAASYYRKFVAAVKDAPNLDKVQKYIEEMDACVAAQNKKPEPALPPPPPTPPPAPTPVPATAPAVVVAPPAAEPADPGATKRHVGIALGVVGLAGFATGIYFTHGVGAAENDHNRLVKTCTALTCNTDTFKTVDDRGHRDQILAITSYAVGGAAIAAGVALYVLGHDHGDEHVAVLPVPGGAYASIGYAF